MNDRIEKICLEVSRRIVSGELKPGAKVPTEHKLAELYHTSRMNAHRALDELRKNELLVSHRSLGSTVNPLLDMIRARKVHHSFNRRILVFHHAEKLPYHINESTFEAFEKIVVPQGYEVCYRPITYTFWKRAFQAMLEEPCFVEAGSVLFLGGYQLMELIPEFRMRLQETGKRFYYLNRGDHPLDFAGTEMAMVSFDHYGDGLALGRLLRKNGYRQVMMLNSPAMGSWSVQRYEGLKNGLGDGVPEPKNILSTLYTMRVVREFIRKNGKESVIVPINNEFAVNCVETMEGYGLACGRDYQLITFDDNPEFHSLGLTSLAFPVAGIGRLFGQMITDRSWLGEYQNRYQIMIGSELVVRRSINLRFR